MGGRINIPAIIDVDAVLGESLEGQIGDLDIRTRGHFETFPQPHEYRWGGRRFSGDDYWGFRRTMNILQKNTS